MKKFWKGLLEKKKTLRNSQKCDLYRFIRYSTPFYTYVHFWSPPHGSGYTNVGDCFNLNCSRETLNRIRVRLTFFSSDGGAQFYLSWAANKHNFRYWAKITQCKFTEDDLFTPRKWPLVVFDFQIRDDWDLLFWGEWTTVNAQWYIFTLENHFEPQLEELSEKALIWETSGFNRMGLRPVLLEVQCEISSDVL